MATSRVSTSSILQGFPKSRSLLSGNPAYSPPSFESIATVTAAGSETSINFSSIPSTYKHLQIRFSTRGLWAATGLDSIRMQVNSSTGFNYTNHELRANGSSVTVTGFDATWDNAVYLRFAQPGDNNTANIFSGGIIDIIDYASTTKNKTISCFIGCDLNGSGGIELNSSAWLQTTAISSIQFLYGNGFKANSTISLYGIKGA